MRLVSLSLCSLAIAAVLSACGGSDGPEKSRVAVIGDVPYGTTPTDTVQLVGGPKFVSAINADADLSAVLHLGDIHSGKSYCTQAYNQTVFDQWKAFRMPLVYAIGDNEWADCHKKAEGGGVYNAATGAIDYVVDASGTPVNYAKGDPLANLDLVRSMFFATPGQTLGKAMTVHTQAKEFDPAYPKDRNYVENVWWMQSGVLFVTMNIPGGSNDNADPWYGVPTASAAQKQEAADRSAANLRWLDKAFREASNAGALGVVIQIQADLWYLDGNVPSHVVGYKPYVDRIAANTKSFGKPVLLLNGDSHAYRSDNPLVANSACVAEPSSGGAAVACKDDVSGVQPYNYNVANFRRVIVHGSTAPLEYLKLTIDPQANAANGVDAFGPFSWKRVQPAL